METGGAGQEALETAELVLSELLTNALRVRVPSDRQVGVRIAHSTADGLLRLEVSDAGEGRPELRSPEPDDTGGRGLLIVDALAHCWGVSPRAGGIGKTIWAELKAPDLRAGPETTEMAAVTVRTGQLVRVWGEWHTVRSVRAERYVTGGLGLDEGPPLRVPAAEPLEVRCHGVSSPRSGGEDTPD
ncbi:ATP-binding protein [Streptomyces sp. NPDC090045]|uniref:ATP-binding protein n=1 Tax=Streptomyces sp. NPDC090045 TaxID=3365927 RepID=UPI00381F58C4